MHVRQFSAPKPASSLEANPGHTRTAHTDAHINLSTHNCDIHFTGNQICLIHCDWQSKKVRTPVFDKRPGKTGRVHVPDQPKSRAGSTGHSWGHGG